MHFSVPSVVLIGTLCIEVLINFVTGQTSVNPTFATATNATTTKNWTTPNNTEGTQSLSAYTTPVPDGDWVSGLSIFIYIGFGVLVAMVIFLLIPNISITLDRIYWRRHVKTYTVNRRDRIGVELQEATDASLDSSDRDAQVTSLMLPEPVATICGPVPATPPPVEQQNSYGDQSQKISPLGGPYETEETKLATESLDSAIDQLTNIAGNFTWPSLVEESPAENLRDRSQSGGGTPDTKSPKSPVLLYSKPQKGGKASLSNEVSAGQSEPLGGPHSGFDDGKPLRSFQVTKGDKDAAGVPTSPDELRNKSYLHSPTAASNLAAIPKWKPKTPVEDEASKPKSNLTASSQHVYEELKDASPEARSLHRRMSVSESNLVQSPGCKITFPQYFEVNGCTGMLPHPMGAQPAPLSPGSQRLLPDSVNQLAKEDVSSDEEDKKKGSEGYECAVTVRTRKGLMARSSLSTKHRLSDGALEKPPMYPPRHYGSLQRGITASSQAGVPYAKLNRLKPANKPNLPVSSNVYNRLAPPVNPVNNWVEAVGGGTCVIETSL